MKRFLNIALVLIFCFMQPEVTQSKPIDRNTVAVLAQIIEKRELKINDDDITSTWIVRFKILKIVQGKTNLRSLTFEVIGTNLPQSNLMFIVFSRRNENIEIIKYLPVHRIVCIEDSDDLNIIEMPLIDDSTCNRIID